MSNEEPITEPTTGPSVVTDITGAAIHLESEQQIPVETDELLGLVPKATNSIPTSFHFDIEKIIGQWQHITTATFSSATKQGQYIKVNFEEVMPLYSFKTIRHFRYFRADREFLIEFSESPQVVGMFVLLYVPTEHDQFISNMELIHYKWCQYPHQLIKLGAGKTYCVKLPWVSTTPGYYNNLPYSTSNLKSIDNGMFVLAQLTPITAVEGVSNEIKIKVWARYTNPQYEGYVPNVSTL